MKARIVELWNDLADEADDPIVKKYPRLCWCIKAFIVLIFVPIGLLNDAHNWVRLWWWKRSLTDDKIADIFCEMGALPATRDFAGDARMMIFCEACGQYYDENSAWSVTLHDPWLHDIRGYNG